MTPTPCGCRIEHGKNHREVDCVIVFCERHAEAHVAKIEAALKNANRMIGEQAVEFAGIKAKLVARVGRLRDALMEQLDWWNVLDNKVDSSESHFQVSCAKEKISVALAEPPA